MTSTIRPLRVQPWFITSATRRGRLAVNSSSSLTGWPSESASGILQLGYSSVVPGWFWARFSPAASASDATSTLDPVNRR